MSSQRGDREAADSDGGSLLPLPRPSPGQLLFVLGVLAAIVFSLLAHQHAQCPGDLEIGRWVQSLRSPWLDSLLWGVTVMGWFWPATALVLAAALALALARRRLEAIFMVGTLSAFGMNSLIKIAVARPRPTALVVLWPESSPYGFPSGHVMLFVTFYGFLSYLAWTRLPSSSRRTLALFALSLPIALVGLSRIYAGVHWPSDVVGGYLIGGLWLVMLVSTYRVVRSRTVDGDRAEGHWS